MINPGKIVMDKIGEGIEYLKPFAYRFQRASRHIMRRAMRKPRTVAESPNLLPLLIQVLAAFSKFNGKMLEDEIDSSLGFLRHDYPEAVYSELRRLFRQALNEQQDLASMAQRLANDLSMDRKIMLGVQLYDLISKAGGRQEQVVSYYSFMSQLGMAAQAIDIVYQLNAADHADVSVYQKGASPLESLSFGHNSAADVDLKGLGPDERLLVFRYHDLIILKNHTNSSVVVRGQSLARGEFCRVFAGQAIVLGEQVLTYQDLVAYFNAKKNVSLAQIYVSVGRDDEVDLQKARTRESCLEVKFGLKVQVRALKNVDAVLNGIKLRSGAYVEGALEDRIIFHNDSELALIDLRRKARALGGRFQLKTHKSEYLVSNNPGLLEEDDILLSPGTGGDVLLKIQCDYGNKIGSLEVLQSDRPILVGDTPVRSSAPLADGDTITIDTGQLLRCNFSERILEEERNIISSLDVHDLTHHFRDTRNTGLDGISFSAARGEMICVMGASGSGKSTLMRTLAGQLTPSQGEVQLNGQSLYDNVEHLKKYITYIPQDDAFDELLTIEENLDLAAALRSPHLSVKDRLRRIDGKLIELGLTERRDNVVGNPTKKILSGGERKRLNIGLDMIGSADIYLFDEPTSGLSSKDSEHVIEIIRGMAHNKIVLVTLHQPTSKLFHMFNKALLLDKGGRLVFFGTPTEMLAYFAEAEHHQHFGTELGGCPACGTTRPEFIFDVLETPLRDLTGDIIYEENNQGQLIPARRFSPEFWRDKYESHRLIQDVRQVSVRRQPPPAMLLPPVRGREPIRWRDEWMQLKTLMRRAFKSKMRNRANLFTTIVEAPMLAALIGGVMRYSESGHYDFASAYYIPQYLFFGLVVAMFLGLTNSADDIIRDRVILQRERNLDVRLPYYICSKFFALCVFSALQCTLFVLIGNAILEVRGMFWIYFSFLFITSFTGVALGLFVSSLVADAKTAANIVPLILIPNIVLGGALIKYDEMNRNLDLLYTFQHWYATHSANGNAEKEEMTSKLTVPLVCEFIPMRWSYEALVVAQAKDNPFDSRQGRLQAQIDKLVKINPLSDEQSARLEDLKDALAMLSGLEAPDPAGIDRRLSRVDRILEGKPLNPNELNTLRNAVSVDALYENQKISDLVSKAEAEQLDHRRTDPVTGQFKPINVFFGPLKYFYLGRKQIQCSVLLFNSFVLIVFSLGILGFLHISLRRQLSVST